MSMPHGLGFGVASGKLSRPQDGQGSDLVGVPSQGCAKHEQCNCSWVQSGQVRLNEKTFRGPSPHPHATGARLPKEFAVPSPAERSTARDGQK